MGFSFKDERLCPFPIAPELGDWHISLRLTAEAKTNFQLPVNTNFIMASHCPWDVNQLWIMILITWNLIEGSRRHVSSINQYLNATSVDGYGFVFAFSEPVSNKTDYRIVELCIYMRTDQSNDPITGCEIDGKAQ